MASPDFTRVWEMDHFPSLGLLGEEGKGQAVAGAFQVANAHSLESGLGEDVPKLLPLRQTQVKYPNFAGNMLSY